jgi:hypothetical protein
MPASGTAVCAVLLKIHSRSSSLRLARPAWAVARISASVPGEVGKFEPQARRSAPKASTTLGKKVSALAWPFFTSPKMRGVSFK